MCINIIRNNNKIYKSLIFTFYRSNQINQINQINQVKQINQIKQINQVNKDYLDKFKKIENRLGSYNKINKV